VTPSPEAGDRYALASPGRMSGVYEEVSGLKEKLDISKAIP
jgi:hypothetical protein